MKNSFLEATFAWKLKVILPPKYHFLCVYFVFLFALFMRKNIKAEVKKKKKRNTLNLNAKFCHRVTGLILFILSNWKVKELSLDMAIILGKD